MQIVDACIQTRNYLLEKCETPWDINDGDCETFAEMVCSEVPGAKWFWMGDETNTCRNLRAIYKESDGPPNHCVVEYEGRYYDAESCEGVDCLCDLSVIINRNKSREEVLAEREVLI